MSGWDTASAAEIMRDIRVWLHILHYGPIPTDAEDIGAEKKKYEITFYGPVPFTSIGFGSGGIGGAGSHDSALAIDLSYKYALLVDPKKIVMTSGA